MRRPSASRSARSPWCRPRPPRDSARPSRSASPSALCDLDLVAVRGGQRRQRRDARVRVAGVVLGVRPADLRGHVPGRVLRDAGQRVGRERELASRPRGSRAATSCASIRSGRMCAAMRACTSATRCGVVGVERVGQRQEHLRRAVAARW